MYIDLGVPKGISLLGGLSVMGIVSGLRLQDNVVLIVIDWNVAALLLRCQIAREIQVCSLLDIIYPD